MSGNQIGWCCFFPFFPQYTHEWASGSAVFCKMNITRNFDSIEGVVWRRYTTLPRIQLFYWRVRSREGKMKAVRWRPTLNPSLRRKSSVNSFFLLEMNFTHWFSLWSAYNEYRLLLRAVTNNERHPQKQKTAYAHQRCQPSSWQSQASNNGFDECWTGGNAFGKQLHPPYSPDLSPMIIFCLRRKSYRSWGARAQLVDDSTTKSLWKRDLKASETLGKMCRACKRLCWKKLKVLFVFFNDQ